MIRAYEAGEGTYDELAALFALSARTTQRWVLRFRAEGTVVPLPKGGGWQSPIQLPLLHTLVAEAPDATCAELCWAYNRRAPAAHKTTRNVARFCGCRAGRSRSAAGIILEHVIGATHGTPLARNRRWRRRVDVGHLIFVDEAGATLAMGRSHAWVAKGAEYVEPRPMTCGKKLRLIGAIDQHGWVTLGTQWAVATADSVVVWVRDRLAPQLRDGDIVALDSLSL